MKKLSQKRIDVYDIGDGLTLMNVINKNENGKMHQITTYEYYGAAEPPVRCGESHLSGLTEPLRSL